MYCHHGSPIAIIGKIAKKLSTDIHVHRRLTFLQNFGAPSSCQHFNLPDFFIKKPLAVEVDTLTTFKSGLKTLLFDKAYC